jgi:hypothetical protein
VRVSVSDCVRLIPLLLLALVLVACGSAAQETGVPASSGEESASGEETAEGEGTASGGVEPSPEPLDESDLKPPKILLLSETGRQSAVLGSYCVDYVDEATGQGSGICSDAAMPTYPDTVTSVAAGDRVTFVLPEAAFRPDTVVVIRPLGCTERVLEELALDPGASKQSWQVDLEHGAYQLDVFARFKADDGRSGDVSGSLGLTVAGPKKWDDLGVTGVERSMEVCEFPA